MHFQLVALFFNTTRLSQIRHFHRFIQRGPFHHNQSFVHCSHSFNGSINEYAQRLPRIPVSSVCVEEVCYGWCHSNLFLCDCSDCKQHMARLVHHTSLGDSVARNNDLVDKEVDEMSFQILELHHFNQQKSIDTSVIHQAALEAMNQWILDSHNIGNNAVDRTRSSHHATNQDMTDRTYGSIAMSHSEHKEIVACFAF